MSYYSWPTGHHIYAPDDESLQHWAFIEQFDIAPAGFIDAPEFIPAGASTAEFNAPHPVTVLRG